MQMKNTVITYTKFIYDMKMPALMPQTFFPPAV